MAEITHYTIIQMLNKSQYKDVLTCNINTFIPLFKLFKHFLFHGTVQELHHVLLYSKLINYTCNINMFARWLVDSSRLSVCLSEDV